MCEVAPGPRCAAHTRADLNKAKATLTEARRIYTDKGTHDAKLLFETARRDLYKAAIAYHSTPEGETEILTVINKKKERGADAGTEEGILAYARALRGQQVGARNAVRSATAFVVTTSNVPAVKGKKLSMSPHALKTAIEKGFSLDIIRDTFLSPKEVYPSRSYPGQYRITGNGVCLVGEPDGNQFRVITLYADKVITAPRPDQLKTPEGARFAERYAYGLGRG